MSDNVNQAWMRHLESVRWFGGKGAGAQIVRRDPLPTYTPQDACPAVRSEIATLSYPDGHEEYYHLLVAAYPVDAEAQGTVVTTDEIGGRQVKIVDATTDPAALEAFVRATEPAFADREIGVWKGEQSNTSLTLGKGDLYKLFRRVEPGPNLDAEVLVALGGGSVPEVRGRLLAAWPEGHSTDLGVVVERIQGAQDGWELACEACRHGESFEERAHALGSALRDVHTRLALAFGTHDRPGDEVADAMGVRLDAAVRQASALAPYTDALRTRFQPLRGRELRVQRIHGDFHLGQTLATTAADGTPSWSIIDFEGEPAKTAAERREFDSVWRDVAGMLRSFDYVRSAHPEPESDAARTWAEAASSAFVQGYCGGVADDELMTPYVIDKAVYEVIYETRNRPDWVGIPLGAVASAAAPSPDTTGKE